MKDDDTQKPPQEVLPKSATGFFSDGRKFFSDWKVFVAAIASTATVASGVASAIAAWQSSSTARATENISRQELNLSGAKPLLLDNVEFSGDCNPGNKFSANVVVRNLGHIATSLTRLVISLDYSREGLDVTPTSEPTGTPTPVLPKPIAVARDLTKEVPPQDQARVALPVDCEAIGKITRPESAASDLVDLINGRRVIGTAADGRYVATASAYLSALFGTGDGSLKKIQHAARS